MLPMVTSVCINKWQKLCLCQSKQDHAQEGADCSLVLHPYLIPEYTLLTK